MNSTDKTKNKMNVLVVSTDSVVGNNDQKQNEINCIIKSKELICPKCRENILIKFDNYNITLYNCKNKHKEENISFNKFEETQKIDLSKIICNSCKERNKSNEYNNEFYKCLTCNIDLCPLCLKQHDQNLDLFMETSAKTGYNTKDILIEAAKLLYREYYKHEKKIESNIKIDNNFSNDNNKIRNKNENICLIEFN